MTGLALLQAAMAGKIPPASIAETVPMKPVAVEEGTSASWRGLTGAT